MLPLNNKKKWFDLQKLPGAKCQLLKEVFSRVPGRDAVRLLNVFWFGPLQYRTDVLLWVPDLFHLNLCRKVKKKAFKI